MQTGRRFVGWAKSSDARSAADGVPTIQLSVWNKDGGHGARAPFPPLRVSQLKRADGEITQPQIGVAAFFPDPEQRPVQRLPQQVVALAHGNPDALAEKAALDKRPAGERAAFGGIGAVDPERQRDRIPENEIDLTAPQRQPQRLAPSRSASSLAKERSSASVNIALR